MGVNVFTLKKNNGNQVHRADNTTEKQASLTMLRAVTLSSARLGTAEAQHRLVFFGDYVADEMASPNAHPNIHLLLESIEYDLRWIVSFETDDN
jgi:hypothetical protein